uniref:Uncharacterized protein n=1 Tax=Sarcophilus harrisii TaxID=9305 RepID=A0A7N4PYQ9_SARHA
SANTQVFGSGSRLIVL